MISIDINLLNPDFGFEATDAYGNKVKMDTSPETGGNNFGSRPMQMLLMALGGCSGIDMVSILKKQRQTIEHFNMKVNAVREVDVEPALWIQAHIIFELGGKIDLEKAQRAAQLSMEKYCSVGETLRRAGCELTWEVKMV